jgi:Carboxypeptidase regulatory-like domain
MRNRAQALWIAVWTAALLLSGARIVAQDTAPQIYPVRGTVIDSITHQPIARALVDSHTQGAALTDNDGHFEFDLPAGSVNFMVRRPGYEPHTNMLRGHNVQVGPNIPDLTFTLTPEAFITGQVTLSTADPADGIRVVAYRRHIVNGRQQWTMQSMATTNSEGIFRIARLEAGDYLLYTESARGREGSIQPGAKTFGYPPVYYPGTADTSSSAVLTLTTGQHAQADFTLTRQPYYSVTFTVTDLQAAAISSFQILDTSGHPTGFPVRWNTMQRIVQATVPNGHYYLETRGGGSGERAAFSSDFLERRGGNPGQMYGRTDFTVANAPLTGLSLSLLPIRSIPVVIHRELTANTSNQGKYEYNGPATDLSADLNMLLIPVDAFQTNIGMNSLRRVEGSSDNSTFAIDNVLPGRYWVQTQVFQGYVTSIDSGGADLAREPLTIGPGGASAPIEITLRNDVGVIQGQIKSPSGAAAESQTMGERSQAYIWAIPLFSSTQQITQGFSQAGNQFTISNLAPGSYRVLVFDAPQEIDYHTPEGLAKYTGKGQTVTVEAGGTANAQVEVIQTGEAEPQP